MPIIEFALSGPPFSVNNRGGGAKHKKNYRSWIQSVRASAAKALPDDHVPIQSDTSVVIEYYYRTNFRDIDNIIKPILDALGRTALADKPYGSLVLDDDRVVNRLLVERVELPAGEYDNPSRVRNPSPVLAAALIGYNEVVYVKLEWETI